MRANELAKELGLSKGRISQMVAAGKLEGCYVGDGIHRRFDLGRCTEALNRNLDIGQMLGNGAGTRRALQRIQSGDPATAAVGGDALNSADPDYYKAVKTAQAEETLRSWRLKNGREEGLFVLASEVERQVSRVLAQEIAEMEVFLRDTAAVVASQLSVDARAVRQILTVAWRAHRGGRSKKLALAVEAAAMNEAEEAAQI